MDTVFSWVIETVGSLQPSASFVIIMAVGVTCAFTIAGSIIAPRLVNREGHPEDAEVAEDQDTWTELMRQLS